MKTKNTIEDIYPLAPMQQGILFHSLYAPESGVYFMQLNSRLKGKLDVAAFKETWQEILQRHTILRTAFNWEQREEPFQIVYRQTKQHWEEADWRDYSAQEQEERLKAYLLADREQGFDLTRAPLMRLHLLHLEDEVYQFVWSHHHLLLDGWSCGILFKEVFTRYEEIKTGKPESSSPSPAYGEYIAWLQRQDLAEAKDYWQNLLKGFTTPTPLPAEQANTGWLAHEEDSATQQVLLPEQLTQSIQHFTQQQSLTINTLLQAAWALLLKTYTGEKDVVFGTVVAGRPVELKNVDNMVGLFCNTLPTRIQMPDKQMLLPWLKKLQQQQAEQSAYEYSPLLQIQRWSDIPPGSSLFESIMVFENYPMDTYLQEQAQSLEIQNAQFFERTNYPISIQTIPGQETTLRIDYDTRRFNHAAIQRILKHFRAFLEQIIAQPEQELGQISPLTLEERKQILVHWNETERNYSQQQNVCTLFEEQVLRSPDAMALCFQEQTLTYRDLNERANQLAHLLQQYGVGPDILVGLHLERGPELIVAVLAVLKAGGAYLPLEASLPPERIALIMEQARFPLVLTQQQLYAALPTEQSQIFTLEFLYESVTQQPIHNLHAHTTLERLAYVLFTSGSTGLPKGVMITHRGLLNYLLWACDFYSLAQGPGTPLHSPLGFDLTITSLFPSLLTGRTVWLLPQDHGIEGLLEILRQGHHFSLVKLTPAHLSLLNQLLSPQEAAESTHALVIGGEELLGEQVRFWQEYAPQVRILNEYGPTETVVGCAIYQARPQERFSGGVPIGHPIANTQLYLLDPYMQPVPVGVAGELYIGGAGVARGYLHQPDLSALRFVPHPYSQRPGARLYKTGDLARYQEDGILQFLGRSDHQVKVRGYRIELGEIENVIKQLALVNECAVHLREDQPGNKRLVAYVVPTAGVEFDARHLQGQLRQHMLAHLPEYMVPQAIVLLDALPLTGNGKVDRQALPIPERRNSGQKVVTPRAPIAQQLGVLWTDLLKISEVSIHDNFFELGGHSLLLTQLATRIRKTFQLDLPLPTLFQTATLEQMANAIEAAQREQTHLLPEEPILPISREQLLPLSFAQQRLWFLQQLNPSSAAYNIPAFVQLRGTLAIPLLEQALNAVIQRHEALHTVFSIVGTQVAQVVITHAQLTLPVIEVETANKEELERVLMDEALHPFDLAHELPLRASLFKKGPEEYILALTMHHIVSDAWASGLLVQEVSLFYQALLQQEEAQLPTLTIQYADFAAWQRQRLQGELLETLLSYWRKQLHGAQAMLNLPFDHPRPSVQTFEGNTEHFTLSPELTQNLLKLARKEQVTLFMLLVTAFNTLLYYYSQQKDILVGTPIANRTREETEALIGVFMNTLVLRTHIDPEQSFRTLLTQVRRTALEAYAHQDLPFEFLVEALVQERSMSHHPLFQVMFVLQNAPLYTAELPGLQLDTLEIPNQVTKFDLTLFMEEHPAGLHGLFEYNTQLFEVATIKRMQRHFELLLQKIVQDSKEPISKLTPLTEDEQQALLQQLHTIEQSYPSARNIQSLIEGQVSPTPHKHKDSKYDETLHTPVAQKLAPLWEELLEEKVLHGADDFFALGGHSLLLTQLMLRIRTMFQVEISLRALFQVPAFSEMVALVERELREQQQVTSLEPIPTIARTQTLPLSFAQKRLWFLQQLEPQNPAYNIPFLVNLTGDLDIIALKRTLQEIIKRHEILRTTYVSQQEEPVQIINDTSTFKFYLVDLSGMPEATRNDALRSQVLYEVQSPFDLARDQPVRATLFITGPQEQSLLLNLHHIASDGWSTEILVQEIAAYYPAFVAGQPLVLPPLSIQYADFAVWQQGWLQDEILKSLLSYWQQQLKDAPPLLNLPTDHPRPSVQSYQGATQSFTLSHELSQAVNQLAKDEHVTLFMLLLTAFQLLLHIYSQQDDILVGTPIANRTRSETEQLIGVFINTLVLRTRFDTKHTFKDLLRQVRDTTLEAYTYQDLPFEVLVETLAPERNLSHHPLFQTMFVLQNTPRKEVTFSNLTLQQIELESSIAKFDLTLAMEEDIKGLSGSIEYSTTLFEAETITRLIAHFQMLLENIIDSPEQAIWKFVLVTPQERRIILKSWNATQVEYTRFTCLPQLFTTQAQQMPARVALKAGEVCLSYGDLETRTNQLARYLQQQGVRPEVLVGVHMVRSIEMVIAILSVLKAGGAYVPLEVGLPDERLAFLVQETQMPIVLTQNAQYETFATQSVTVLALDQLQDIISQEVGTELEQTIEPHNLAYVLYTSGSTGVPKGVMVPHQGLVNYLTWAAQNYGSAEGNGSPVHSPLSFDLTITSLFTPLLLGQTVELLPQEQEIEHLLTTLSAHKSFSLVKLTPAHLTLLNQWLKPQDAPESTHAFVIGGEELRHEHIAYWQQYAPHIRLLNEYGPTETVVGCCVYEVQADENDELIPIGRPINNTQLYLLDKNMQLVPLGVPGELYIGGEGVTRGYCQRPDLTAERYIPHPYSEKPGERLYKTGDLARYRADGVLTFLGRIDQQVKLRGYRVELGEIEQVLKQHPQVQTALVIVREDQPGDKRLTAYVVPNELHADAAQLLQSLQKCMQEKLPAYMLPTYTMLLEALPLTTNGKVNRKALPIPEPRERGQEYQIPHSPLEQQLATLWQSILGIDHVSLNDNFFELGGHSLLLTQLATRIRTMFKLEIPLRLLFQAPTLTELATLITKEQHTQRHLVEVEPIQRTTREHPLPLSFTQQRLWFLQQFDTSNPTYNIPLLVRLTGTLQQEALEHALIKLVARHEILRTTFATVQNEPMQHIQAEFAFRLPIVDLSTLPNEQRERDLQQIIKHELQQTFDLVNDLPLRGHLLRLDEHEHVLLLMLHHIASDAWSTSILFEELATLYTAEIGGKDAELRPLPIQYGDFAAWQRNWLKGSTMERLLSYWKVALADAPALLNLPTDHPRPMIQSYRGATLPFLLTQELFQQLKQLAQYEQVTLFMLLLSAFNVLLSNCSRQNDILVGTPIANRMHEETEQLIGVFINTLVLRTRIQRRKSFQELLKQVRNATLEAYAHQDLPFEVLVEALAPERNLSHHPLFQVMFVLQNTPQRTIELPELELQALEQDGTGAKFDLSLSLEEISGGLRGTIEYSTDLFEEATITRLLGHFQLILQAIVADPTQELWRLSPLMQWERTLLLSTWNETREEYEEEACLHELFAEQAKRTPEAVAVIYEEQQLTYRQLNEQASLLAQVLQAQHVGPDVIVGVYMERSHLLVIALLAVLKAGGAYMPLDPGYPQERLAFMLSQAQTPLLLTTETYAAQLSDYQGHVLNLDKLVNLAEYVAEEQLSAYVSPDNLAYVLYTSGSTGQPKGVMITHRAICNHMHWFQQAFPQGSEDRVLQKTPFSFDASVWEFYAPLLSGGTLVMAQPGGHQDSTYLVQTIKDYQITTLQLVPSQLQMLLQEPQFATCTSLRWLFCGGEELPVALYKNVLAQLPVELHNLYGPSETCIDATYWRCTPTSLQNSTPIGKPIANMQAYVLDDFLQLTAPGVVGELYLSGTDLARGYMQRPELTAERFLPHPFSQQPGERLYKTGDLARYLPDGILEYSGRADQQVKVRGFRIELGEIEAALSQHPSLQECVVVVREDQPGDKRLVAYLVPREQPAPSTSELRQFLLAQLPSYMVPSFFVPLEALPRTPNGKIERKALPVPANARPQQEQSYVAPRTAVEQTLTDIWSAVLGINQIGVNDNFFELGGDSILSIQIVARANEAGLRLSPRQVFKHQTVAQLAEVINQLPPILAEQGTVSGNVLLTPIQHWFFEQKLDKLHHWNQALLLELRQEVEGKLLEQALQHLVQHHDALRMSFTKEADGWQQWNQDTHQNIHLLEYDLTQKTASEQTAEIEQRAAQLQTSLRLTEGPLLQIALFKLGEQRADRLLVIIHHLVIDGVSWMILLEDLQTIYQQLSRGKAARLPQKTTSFQQWAQRLTEYAQSEALEQELPYWSGPARSNIASIPRDLTQSGNLESSAETLSISLNKDETNALLQKVPAVYRTEINDVLLTALAEACASWTKSRTLLLDLEGHGRETLFEDLDLSRTIGWFTTLYPVLLDLGSSTQPWESLKLIKEQLRTLPGHGIGYGLLRYLSPQSTTRETLRSLPQAEISFNYLGQFDQGFAGSSLFRTAPEESGPVRDVYGQRHYVLDVTGYVEGGQLHMNWRYSKTLHHQTTIKKLAQRFQENLQMLIEHCESPEAGGYTPSDFPAAALNQKDLDTLLSKLSNPKKSRRRG